MFDLGQRFFHSKSEQIENWQLKRPVSSIDIYNTVSSLTCLAYQAGSIRDPVGNDGKVKTQKLKVKSNSK